MYTPVLVEGPDEQPVSLDEAKLHCRVDSNDRDTVLLALIEAATQHVEQHLNRKLVTQTWRQTFDLFDTKIRLFAPVSPDPTVSVIWTDEDGDPTTIAAENYELLEDDRGAYVRFIDDFDTPSDLAEAAAVQIEVTLGYGAAEFVPAPIKAAILLLVAHWLNNAEAVAPDAGTELPLGVKALLAPYRRFD